MCGHNEKGWVLYALIGVVWSRRCVMRELGLKDARGGCMQFHDGVIRATFAGVPLVGNLDNGHVVGLDPEGDRLCGELLAGEVSRDEACARNAVLVEHLEQRGFFARRQPLGITHAYVHVTQRCNLRCKGCYSLDAARNAVDDPLLCDVKQALSKLAATGVSRVVISGGEPFMRADLPEILAHAKRECGIERIEVLTNGTCISDDCIARIAGCVDHISISLDVPSADQASCVRGYDRLPVLLDAVKRVQKAGISVSIKATMHRKNAGDLDAYAALANELGCGVDYSLLTCPPGGCDADLLPDDEALRRLAQSLVALNRNDMLDELRRGSIGVRAKGSCKAAVNLVSVAYDGEVYPCHMLHREGLSMGNLFRDGVKTIEKSPVRRAFLEFTADDVGECQGCSYKWFCGGGCQARTFGCADVRARRRDDYCVLMKEYFGLYESMLEEVLAR